MRALAPIALLALNAAGCTGEPAQAARVEPAAAAAPAASEPPPVAAIDPSPSPSSPSSPTPPTPPTPPSSPTPASPASPHKAAAPTPMKDWMTSSLGRPVKLQDFGALERGLRTTAGYAPPEFAQWRAMAERGARAAAARDIEGVRASCTACHNEYRADYREQMRTRPLAGVN